MSDVPPPDVDGMPFHRLKLSLHHLAMPFRHHTIFGQLIFGKTITTVAHGRSYTKFYFGCGCAQTPLGSLQRSQDTLAGFKEAERGWAGKGEGRKRKGGGTEREGKGWEEKERRGKCGVPLPVPLSNLITEFSPVSHDPQILAWSPLCTRLLKCMVVILNVLYAGKTAETIIIVFVCVIAFVVIAGFICAFVIVCCVDDNRYVPVCLLF